MELTAKLKEKALKGLAWTSLQELGRVGLSSITLIILLRLLKPHIFGLMAIALSFILFMGTFLRQGFLHVLTHREIINDDHLDTAFWINNAICLMVATATILTSKWVAVLFKEPLLEKIIFWLSISILLNTLTSFPIAIFTRKFRFRIIALSSFISISAGNIIGIFMAYYGFGIWSLVAQYLITNILPIAILWPNLKWMPHFNFSIEAAKDLLSFEIPMLGISISMFLSERANTFLVGYFFGPSILGYYTCAQNMSYSIMTTVTMSMSKVGLSFFSRMQFQLERLRNVFYAASELLNIMITPFFVIILLLPKELISVFFGEKWLPAAPILQVMAISGFLCSIYNIHTPIIVGLGKPLWQLRRNVTIFVINIAAFFLALPYGIVAVVMAFVISNYIAMIITLLIIHELTSFDPVRYLRTYIIPIVANALMAVILIFPIVLYRDVLNAPFSLAIYPAIGLMMYYTTIILLKPQFFHQVLTLARIALFTKMDEKYERSK